MSIIRISHKTADGQLEIESLSMADVCVDKPCLPLLGALWALEDEIMAKTIVHVDVPQLKNPNPKKGCEFYLGTGGDAARVQECAELFKNVTVYEEVGPMPSFVPVKLDLNLGTKGGVITIKHDE